QTTWKGAGNSAVQDRTTTSPGKGGHQRSSWRLLKQSKPVPRAHSSPRIPLRAGLWGENWSVFWSVFGAFFGSGFFIDKGRIGGFCFFSSSSSCIFLTVLLGRRLP